MITLIKFHQSHDIELPPIKLDVFINSIHTELKYVTNKVIKLLNERYNLQIKKTKKGYESEVLKESLLIVLNFRSNDYDFEAESKEIMKLMVGKLRENLEEFEREDWPLVNCKDQAQIAKFNKHTMDIPEILA